MAAGHVLVTGGASGIGAAVGRAVAAAGGDVLPSQRQELTRANPRGAEQYRLYDNQGNEVRVERVTPPPGRDPVTFVSFALPVELAVAPVTVGELATALCAPLLPVAVAATVQLYCRAMFVV